MTRITRVGRSRAYVEDIVKSSKQGTILFSDEIAAALRINICYGPSAKDIGMIFRERNDVKNISDGVWEVL